MPSASSRTALARTTSAIAARLSFANVVALLALFVALGGSSYAALRVGSDEIANNSVRSKDLHNNDVRGRDIRKGTVRGTDIRDNDLRGKDVRDDTISGADVKESGLATVPSAQNALTLDGKSASAFLGSDRQSRTGLIKLAHGDTKTVAVSGPFSWIASCIDDGGGNTRLTVTVESTEADAAVGGFDPSMSGTVSPGSPVVVFDGADTGPLYTIGFPLTGVAPSGAAPTGLAFVGLQVADADCVVNGVLWP
jgi:hypothetical protein